MSQEDSRFSKCDHKSIVLLSPGDPSLYYILCSYSVFTARQGSQKYQLVPHCFVCSLEECDQPRSHHSCSNLTIQCQWNTPLSLTPSLLPSHSVTALQPSRPFEFKSACSQHSFIYHMSILPRVRHIEPLHQLILGGFVIRNLTPNEENSVFEHPSSSLPV